MQNNKLNRGRFAQAPLAAITALALTASASALSGELKEAAPKSLGLTQTDVSFNQWRQAQKEQHFEDATDQFVIEFSEGKDGKKEAKRLAKKLKKALKHKKKFKKGKGNKHVFKLAERLAKEDQKAFLELLREDNAIKTAEMDPMRYLMSETVPWGIPRVQADQLSDSASGNLTVCIIDSGYDRTNPDLAANNHTGTNDPGTGNWYQAGGSHGTHVAGTIAGVTNTEGVVGVLPNAQVNLHIVKVFNDSGWGYSSDLVTAVDTCVNNGADIVNMSLGGPSQSTAERTGLEAATAQGVLLIAAAGNDGDASLSYPASYDTVMAVGALDEGNQHAEFSQYTPQVEISAPGEAILSTVAGDGRLGTLTVGGITYGDEATVPQTRYVDSGGQYVVTNVNGTVSGELASCSRTGSTYSCGNMTGKICLAERDANQSGSSYPEVNAAKACADAGAAGVVVYSNSARPGTQNPFLVDATGAVDVPSVSVNRTFGQTLLSKVGQATTLAVVGNQDYAYYNGTSMATPHVAGVAALAWSNNLTCTADEVRTALKQTAIDVDVPGRDDRTGYGLVQAKAASDYMAANCGTTTGNELENGIAKTGLGGSAGTSSLYTMTVPAGATNLSFAMSGGTGDADLYVKFGSEPTTSSYDCRPYLNGNNETCNISPVQGGTYYVKIIGYTTFSGVSLTGSFTPPSSGGQGYSTTVNDISASTGNWNYYTIDVPAGMSTFDVSIANGSGDADLHVRYGAQPTTSTYDCRPYKNGNNEDCSFNNPTSGTWHIGVRAYRTYSNVDLSVSYNP